MEREWVFVVDPRQSFVSPELMTFIPINSLPNLQWAQEKVFFGTRFHISCYDGGFISLISSAIIEDIKSMRHAGSALMAYYYFDFKDASKRDARGMLTSVLFQLGNHSDCCWDVLHNLYTRCDDGSEQPSDASLVGCLRSMFALPGQVPIFIILDALDECPCSTGTPSAREKALSSVEKLVTSNHPNLFICITSRPEQDIQSVLNPLTPARRRVSLHEERGQREDINRYVRSFVRGDITMRRWREEDKELVINTLSERADGMWEISFPITCYRG